MLFEYRKIENIEDSEWVLDKKEHKDLSIVDKIAAEAVLHDLRRGYYKSCDGSADNTLEGDAKETIWNNGTIYTEDEVDRIYLDTYYVFSHLYVTKKGTPVVVVVKPMIDIWAEDSEVASACEGCEHILFVVQY